MDDKVYEPVEVQPVPFPQDALELFTSSEDKSGGTGVAGQQQQAPQAFPFKRVSHELISSVLNTRDRKVRGQFELTESGGFRIGTYQPGLSGEMVLTPAGQSAKNKAGQLTFAIDAETGDVVFLGEIRGGTIDIGNNFSVDVNGNVIANAIQLTSSLSLLSADGINQHFTSSTPDDVTGSSVTITLEHNTLMLFVMAGTGWIYQNGVGDFYGNGLIRLMIDGGEYDRGLISGGIIGSDTVGGTGQTTFAGTTVRTLTKGTHTIKLTGGCDAQSGTPAFNLYRFRHSIVTLGAIF